MKLLIAAATEREIAPFLDYLAQTFSVVAPNYFCKENLEVFVCLTGVGTMLTAFRLADAFTRFRPDFALQVGVAGAYDRNLPLGSLVAVKTEHLGDPGVENQSHFLDVFELGLMSADEPPFVAGKLVNALNNFPLNLRFPTVTSLTVNTASGSETTVNKRIGKFACDIESMEGAPFHYICLLRQVPFLQLRSISNYVEARDTSKWKLEEAIQTLNDWLKENIALNN